MTTQQIQSDGFDDESEDADGSVDANPHCTGEADGPPPRGKEMNNTLFQSAVKGLSEALPAWKMQVDLLAGHPVELAIDFSSLEGRFDFIQPFVHHAVAGTLEALAKVRFDPVVGSALMTAVQSVVIRACPPDQSRCIAELLHGQLTVRAPINGKTRPTEAIYFSLRAALGAG